MSRPILLRTRLPTVAPPVALLPKDVVDLSQWRLDLPTNSLNELYHDMTERVLPEPSDPRLRFVIRDGNPSRSASVNKSAAELVAGFTNSYFFAQTYRSFPFLNLKSPIFGATSSPDELSNNARCELRGLMTGGGPGARTTTFRGIHRPRINGRWEIRQTSDSGATADICQIHPGTQESGYTGPVDSGSVFLIFLWRSTGDNVGRLESAVRDVTNPDVQWNSGQTPNVSGRPILLTDFRVGDELDFEVEWDTRGAQHVLRYTLQQWRNGTAIQSSPFTFEHNIQSGWADRYCYFKAGAYSSKNVLDSLDAREDPPPAGYPSRNTGGLLLPENVTNVNWVGFRTLVQQMMNEGGLPE